MSFSSSFSLPVGGPAASVELPGQRRAEEGVDVVRLADLPRVDLLPASVAAGDRLRLVRCVVVGVVALVAVGAVGAVGLARADVRAAGDDLAAEQARTTALQQGQEQYAEIPVLLAQERELATAVDTAMAEDVLWYRYVAHLGNSLPVGVQLQSISMGVGDVAAAGTATDTAGASLAGASGAGAPVAGTALPDAAGPRTAGPTGPTAVIGSTTLTLVGSAVADSADVVEALGGTPGLGSPWLDRTTVAEPGSTDVEAHADVTGEALSGRFAVGDGAPSGTTATAGS